MPSVQDLSPRGHSLCLDHQLQSRKTVQLALQPRGVGRSSNLLRSELQPCQLTVWPRVSAKDVVKNGIGVTNVQLQFS
jgi:hypothetical protein